MYYLKPCCHYLYIEKYVKKNITRAYPALLKTE